MEVELQNKTLKTLDIIGFCPHGGGASLVNRAFAPNITRHSEALAEESHNIT